MHPIALALVALLLAGARPTGRALPGPPAPAVQATNDSNVVAIADRISLLNATWSRRSRIFRDDARADGRGLFLVLGRDAGYLSRLDSVLGAETIADTTEYEQRPLRPVEQRFWVARAIRQLPSGLFEVEASLSYDAMTHKETWVFRRSDPGAVVPWGLIDVRINYFAYY
jgi:hypothetical protein